MHRLWLICVFALLPLSALAFEESSGEDCRYGSPYAYPPVESNQPHFSMFPVGGFFQPLLADPMEPRLAVTYGRYTVKGEQGLGLRQDKNFSVGIGVLGADFGSFRIHGDRPCKGYQFNFFAAAYAVFDWSSDSIDLLNMDFRVGFPLTMRKGPYSARLRFYHQSSHLGDELILKNPGIQRENLSYEVLDALGSVDFNSLRVYGGGGILIRSKPDLDPVMLQLGAELRTRAHSLSFWQFNSHARPVYGVDIKSYEAQDWGLSAQLVGGLEFFADQGLQRFRLLFTYMQGYVPYGQFFTENRARHFGVNFQFDM